MWLITVNPHSLQWYNEVKKGDTVGSLTSIQHAILVGSMLGDGTLRKQGARKNALFEVNHSVKFKTYVDWKWKHFQEYVLTPPKSRLGKGVRVAYRFTTRSLPIFTSYYRWFYPNQKKQLPDNIKLDAKGLAVWFMDDGTRCRNATYFNTQQFRIAEQCLLRRQLKKIGIRSTLSRDKQYWRLYVDTESTKRLMQIISPYVLSCFQYKLRYDPVTTESKDEISNASSR